MPDQTLTHLIELGGFIERLPPHVRCTLQPGSKSLKMRCEASFPPYGDIVADAKLTWELIEDATINPLVFALEQLLKAIVEKAEARPPKGPGLSTFLGLTRPS